MEIDRCGDILGVLLEGVNGHHALESTTSRTQHSPWQLKPWMKFGSSNPAYVKYCGGLSELAPVSHF